MSTRFVAAHSLAPAQLDQQKAFVAWTQSKDHINIPKEITHRRISLSRRTNKEFSSHLLEAQVERIALS